MKSYIKSTLKDLRTVEDTFQVQALQIFLSEQKYFYNDQNKNITIKNHNNYELTH